MLQIAKERYRRVQLTEFYKTNPEPKKGANYFTSNYETLQFAVPKTPPAFPGLQILLKLLLSLKRVPLLRVTLVVLALVRQVFDLCWISFLLM